MGPTIKDVAKAAGVSPMTASRALHRPHLTAASTRTKVLAACERLNYRPNSSARILRTKRSFQIGLVIPDLRNAFWIDVITGIEEVVTEAGYTLLIGNTNEQHDRLTAETHAMVSRQVDGVLIAPTEDGAGLIQSLQQAGHPVVVMDRLPPGIGGVSCVTINNAAGAYKATRHLIEAGHRRIGLLAGNINLDTGQQALDGYRRALNEHGIPQRAEWIRTASTNAALVGKQVGYEGTLELIRLDHGPRALLCTSNTIAIGALTALHEQRVAIPDEMALVSFGNTDWSALVTPPLTVVTQPTAQLGREAARLLLAAMAGPAEDAEPTHILLEPELIVRSSSQASN